MEFESRVSKGLQVHIPKNLARHLDLKEGTTIVWNSNNIFKNFPTPRHSVKEDMMYYDFNEVQVFLSKLQQEGYVLVKKKKVE